jgi:hypothetical protein
MFDPDRPERPLGRGLEDVSHLFLTRTTAPAAPREIRAPAPGDLTDHVAPATGTILLRSQPEFPRDQLIAALRDFDGGLDEGLRVIDLNVPCDPGDSIDLIAVDRTNRLTVIDADTTADDMLLVRGIAHCDWVVRHAAQLRRIYQGHAINFSMPPRSFLVAPRHSPRLRAAARQIIRPQLDCVTFHVVGVSAATGIFFERADD